MGVKTDPIAAQIHMGPEPTEKDRQRARLVVANNARSVDEARVFLEMLGLAR